MVTIRSGVEPSEIRTLAPDWTKYQIIFDNYHNNLINSNNNKSTWSRIFFTVSPPLPMTFPTS